MNKSIFRVRRCAYGILFFPSMLRKMIWFSTDEGRWLVDDFFLFVLFLILDGCVEKRYELSICLSVPLTLTFFSGRGESESGEGTTPTMAVLVQ